MLPITLGDRGDAVADVQRRLQAAGFAVGPSGVDGVFAEETARAVKSFQSSRGLEPSGVVDGGTWRSLVEASVSLGDRLLYLRTPFFRGDDVRELQQRLNTLGFNCGTADGVFGRMTERAVRDFQQNSGLPADGIVGEATLVAMGKLKNILASKSETSLPKKRPKPFSSTAAFKGRSVVVREDDDVDASPCDELADRLRNLLELLGASVLAQPSGPVDAAVSFDMRPATKEAGYSVEALGRPSLPLAEAIYGQLASSVVETPDGGMVLSDQETAVPTVVVRPGGGACNADLRLLADEAFAQKVAVAVFDGLHDYFRHLREERLLNGQGSEQEERG